MTIPRGGLRMPREHLIEQLRRAHNVLSRALERVDELAFVAPEEFAIDATSAP